MNYFHNTKLRILNFTHVDMDGATSNIIVKNYFKNVITHIINYERENEILPKMIKERDNFDAVIFTDFCPVNLTQVQAFGKPVLVLDHHESALQYNNPGQNVYVCTKFCGAKLTYEYFNHDDCLKHLNDIVDITNDYDLYLLKDPRSKAYNSLFWEFLVRKQKQFNEYYAKLPIQELSNKGVVCESELYISDVADALRKDGYEWCIIYRNGYLSVRSSDDSNINLANVTKRLGKGGGHIHAVGIPQQKENLADLIKRIENEVDVELKNVASKNVADDFVKKLQTA